MKAALCATVMVASLAMLSSSANAAVSLYLGGSYGSSPSYSYSDGAGTNVTATSGVGSSSTPRRVTRNYLGLGVKNSRWDSPQIDGFGHDDFLRLAFDKVVTLLSITFTYVDGDDDFDLTIDGTQVMNEADITSLGTRFGPTWTVPINMTGTTFDIGADGRWDDFMVKRVSVEDAGNDVVPEPTTALIWTALGLGAVMLRRRRHAA